MCSNHLFDKQLLLTAPTNHQAHLPAEISELISWQQLCQTISNYLLGQHVLSGNNIARTKVLDIMVGNVDMLALFINLQLIYKGNGGTIISMDLDYFLILADIFCLVNIN